MKKPIYAGMLMAAMLAAPGTRADPAVSHGHEAPAPDWRLTGTLGAAYSEGDYGTPVNTNVTLGLSTLSLAADDFKFTASVPYMRIAGRGLVVFDAAGNPLVINRRTTAAPDTRTGWGDLNLSASYTVPPALLADFEVRLSAVTKVPIASARRRLSTGAADYGMSVDVSRQIGIWQPFVTVGYLIPGRPEGFALNDTTSVSAGTSLELSPNLVAIASYDFDSATSPLIPAAHELFGSLSWVRGNGVTISGYGTAGLNSGSPDIGGGLLVSFGLN